MLKADSIAGVNNAILDLSYVTDSVQQDSIGTKAYLMQEDAGIKVLGQKKWDDWDVLHEGYFSGSPYFHPELGASQGGVLGLPVPYSPSNDNVIVGLLLSSFIVSVISASYSMEFIFRQIKGFFYTPRIVADTTETATEIRFQNVMVLFTALHLAIVYYLYEYLQCGAEFIFDSQLGVIGILTGVVVVYFILKSILYKIVNWAFFDKKKNEQWTKSSLFLSSMEGVALFVLLVVFIYSNMTVQKMLFYALLIIFSVKILTFYKCYSIFFKRISLFLQFFLYFCALELIPVMGLWGMLQVTSDYLIINS